MPESRIPSPSKRLILITNNTIELKINADRVKCPLLFSQSRGTQIRVKLNNAITESQVLNWMLSNPRTNDAINTIQIMAVRVRILWLNSKECNLFDMALTCGW